MGSKEQLWNLDLFTHQFGSEVREGIDMTEDEVKDSRLKINASMAQFNLGPKERALILDVLGLVTREEIKPELRPEPPIRLCAKKLHNIADPTNYRVRKTQNIFADDRVCLACEADNKARKSQPRKRVSRDG